MAVFFQSSRMEHTKNEKLRAGKEKRLPLKSTLNPNVPILHKMISLALTEHTSQLNPCQFPLFPGGEMSLVSMAVGRFTEVD